jgi:hypothetical protein
MIKSYFNKQIYSVRGYNPILELFQLIQDETKPLTSLTSHKNLKLAPNLSRLARINCISTVWGSRYSQLALGAQKVISFMMTDV